MVQPAAFSRAALLAAVGRRGGDAAQQQDAVPPSGDDTAVEVELHHERSDAQDEASMSRPQGASNSAAATPAAAAAAKASRRAGLLRRACSAPNLQVTLQPRPPVKEPHVPHVAPWAHLPDLQQKEHRGLQRSQSMSGITLTAACDAEQREDIIAEQCATWRQQQRRQVARLASFTLEPGQLARGITSIRTMESMRQSQIREVADVNAYLVKKQQKVKADALENALIMPTHELHFDTLGRMLPPNVLTREFVPKRRAAAEASPSLATNAPEFPALLQSRPRHGFEALKDGSRGGARRPRRPGSANLVDMKAKVKTTWATTEWGSSARATCK